MEPTLSLKKSDFEGGVGHFLGYGRGEDNGERAWSVRQYADVDAFVRSGLRRFYFPEINGQTYEWSFLRPTATLTLGVDQFVMTLPDDFNGIVGQVRVSLDSNSFWPLPVMSEARLRETRALNVNVTGRPEFVAVLPLRGTGVATGQRFELGVYPTANVAHTISFNYNLTPDALTGATPFAYGGAQHAETILESCLAVAEERGDDAQTVHAMRYQRLLAASVSMDRKLGPQRLGYNGDRSEGRGWSRRGNFGTVTIGGVTPE